MKLMFQNTIQSFKNHECQTAGAPSSDVNYSCGLLQTAVCQDKSGAMVNSHLALPPACNKPQLMHSCMQ